MIVVLFSRVPRCHGKKSTQDNNKKDTFKEEQSGTSKTKQHAVAVGGGGSGSGGGGGVLKINCDKGASNFGSLEAIYGHN